MPNYLNKVVYLSEAQKNTLFTNGSVTANGTTITYSDNDIYITPQEYDNAPTSGSNNLITSGAVYSAINSIPAVTESTVSGWGFTKNQGTVTSITPGNGLLNGTGTTAITTSGTLNLSYGTSATAIGTAAAGTANTVSRSDHVHSISLATGDANGQVKIAGTNVSVKGLGSNAYTSTSYLPLAGGTMTGGVTYVGNQSSAWNDKGILFTNGSRIGENSSKALGLYSGSTFYIRPDSATASSGKGIEISSTTMYPTVNNEMSLGDSTHKWTTVYAATFDGNATTATTASKLGTANKGSTTKPIYLAAGVATECNTYAGGTAITLNGTSKAASTASFYAPTGAGTSGQYLKSNGSGAPTWDSITTTDEKVKQTAKTDNVNYKILLTASASPTSGNVAEATYDANITINPSTHTITATNFNGTATKATGDADGNTISSTYLKLSGGNLTGMLGLSGIKGTSGTDYGDELPSTGTEGQLFFLVDDGSNVATSLSTSTSMQVNLASADAATYNGTQSSLSIGVTGTLPVNKGGTGATSFTANSVIMSGGSTTAALTTRAVTNNTTSAAISASTNIPTMNTVRNGLVTVNGSDQTRGVGIYAPTSAGSANSLLVSGGSGAAPTWKATTVGAAYVDTAGSSILFGTLPVNRGGTGATTFTSGNVLVGAGTNAVTTIAKTNANTANTLVQRDSSGNFSAGTITANLTGVASKATAANITSTTNGIAVYSNTTGTFTSKATAAGAVYVTEANGALNFGNLPINKGGTGADTATAACTNLKAFNLDRGAEIPANSNLDNYTTAGVYYSADSTRSATLTNPPFTNAGFKLVVLYQGGTSNLKQIAFKNSSRDIYVRQYSSSSWGNWTYILMGADGPFVKKAGDTLDSTAQLSRVGGNSSWYNGRDKAIIRQTSYTGYNPIVSMKTTNGSWEIGPYTNDILYFVYNSDTGYNSGTNTTGEYVNTVKITKTGQLYGAVWNDYAEFRETKIKVKPGQCVVETGAGDLVPSTDRLQGGAEIVSDTYGFGVGQSLKCNTPIACSGRVLAYPLEDKKIYQPGDAVCSGPNGTISKMTREEIKEWPDRIIGTVSEIPNYEIWQAGSGGAREEIKIDGRIWIRIR